MRALLAFLSVLLAASPTGAAGFQENFSTNPAADGWNAFGDASLFHWDSTNQNLRVTWDSSHTNSFFYHPLGTVLARDDDFSIAFDLYLNDITSGSESNKTGGLSIGVGFLNFAGATRTNFMRGVFGKAPDVAGFDYFPPGYFPDFGPVAATTTPTFISGSGYSYAPQLFAPYEVELPTNQLIHVAMTYTASNQTLVTVVSTNGIPVASLPDVTLTDPNNSGFSDSDDFRVDTFSVSSYSSFGDTYDSVLAHGTIGNIVVTVPPPPAQNLRLALSNRVAQIQFDDRTNWLYTLERTADFQSWADVSPATPGAIDSLILSDTNAPAGQAFYRVRANRP